MHYSFRVFAVALFLNIFVAQLNALENNNVHVAKKVFVVSSPSEETEPNDPDKVEIDQSLKILENISNITKGGTTFVQTTEIKNVSVSSRGSSGINRINGTSRGTFFTVPINWDEAFSQSVKRVFRPRVGGEQYGMNRFVTNFVPVVSPRRPGTPEPPPHEQVAKMARFIVHNSNWTSIATISTRAPTLGYPFANLFSVSDGIFGGNSSGIPYMYLTPLDISVKDLKVDSKCSLTMSLAQGNYCRQHKFDPEDPRCAHVILTGSIAEVNGSTPEAVFAKTALFSRHPDMETWPKDHGWFFAKMDIFNILVLDYFGGAKSIDPQDYFKTYNNDQQ